MRLCFTGLVGIEPKKSRKQDSFLSSQGGEGGNAEILKKMDRDIYEKSLGKVYLTPDKRIARMFAGQTERGGVANLSIQDMLNIQQKIDDPFDNSGVVKVKAPTWKMNVVPNPEARGNFENFLKSQGINKSKLGKQEQQALKSKYDTYSKGTRAIEGDIPTRYIKGSKDYRRTSAKEFKEFVKANPKRFAKGVGAAALGVGVAGASIYGAKKMIDRHREMQKEAGIRDFIRRLREKLTRGRAKPTPKPKPNWEIPIREAGRNRRTVEIQYVDRHGAVSTREVEPYEIKDGHFWGYSLDTNKPGIRKFNLERIQNIKPTSNTFDPRWEVKLAAAMRKPSRNEGEWGETDFVPDGEDKRLRRAYERLREGNRYTVNKSNLYIKMKLRGENPYSKQV